jgi:putative tryptophan/tyrosine transport system substrate-binding protein
MNYGADIIEMYRQIGVYTGNILRGVKPADLPVINRKTARALGLIVPLTLQGAATKIIE